MRYQANGTTYLRYFAAVAEERNIRQAAARLHLSGQKHISTQTTTSGYMLLFRGTYWDKFLSLEEIQEVRSRWTAWFDRLTEQGKAKAGLSLTNEGKIVSGKKGRSVADGPCRSQGRFRFTILEKTARIEIRFDPHRTSTLQLALPSHFTRSGSGV